MAMESYIESATSLVRLFTHPSEFAKERIREKTDSTLKWAAGYLLFMAAATAFAERKEMPLTTQVIMVVLWMTSAYCGALIFRRFNKETGISVNEITIIYILNYCVLLTCGAVRLMLTPKGGEAGFLASSVFILFLYFLIFINPKLIAFLADRSKINGTVYFYWPIFLGFLFCAGILVALVELVDRTTPLGEILATVP
jgi:hypothetical protein